MASRQEEKEQRRLEREQAEAIERAAAARKKRLAMVLGGIAGLAVIALAVFALSGALGGGGDGDGGDGPKQVKAPDNVTLPEPQTSDRDEAAKTAGCKLEHPKFEGAGHEDRKFTAADYESNPPTSGAHFPEWYDDGIYAPGDVPELGKLVHTLEHGRINVQYKPGTPDDVVKKLEAFAAEKTGYHILLYENTTNMDAQVAATAWTHVLTCPTYDDKVIDALRTFYDAYVDKGPEQVP
jgi:hypothetical protein